MHHSEKFLIDIDAFSLAALVRCLLTLQFQFLCVASCEVIANHDANIIVHVRLGFFRFASCTIFCTYELSYLF